jgi:Co/Zn/Cd efflux system component
MTDAARSSFVGKW